MMTSGEPITGIDRRPSNRLGMDIEGRSSIGGQLDAGHHTNKAIFPLSSIAFSRWTTATATENVLSARRGNSSRNLQVSIRAELPSTASLQQIGIDQALER